MKKQYFINANIIDPHNSINENGGLIISEDLTIACGEKALNILEIQRQGRDIMSLSDLIRGFKFIKGDNVNQSTR